MDEARSLQYSIEVKTDIEKAEQDIQSLISQCGKLRAEAAGRVDIEVGADTDGATESIRELTDSIGGLQDGADTDIVVDADTSQAEENVRELTGSIGGIAVAARPELAQQEQEQRQQQHEAQKAKQASCATPRLPEEIMPLHRPF